MIRLVCACFLALLSLGAPAGASDDVYGFGYCAPPVTPSCIDNDAAYRDPSGIAACEIDVTRYAKNLFAYRDCQARETERAVRQTNHAIDRYKCGVREKRRCSAAESER